MCRSNTLSHCTTITGYGWALAFLPGLVSMYHPRREGKNTPGTLQLHTCTYTEGDRKRQKPACTMQVGTSSGGLPSGPPVNTNYQYNLVLSQTNRSFNNQSFSLQHGSELKGLLELVCHLTMLSMQKKKKKITKLSVFCPFNLECLVSALTCTV